jgi:ribosome-associated toxin RatA of RatAB toxin-antitoxin module
MTLYHAEREFEIEVSPEVFFDLVWDFEHYPSFVTGIAAARVLARDSRSCRVEITAKLMGIPFRYELAIEREENTAVRWHRVAGAFARAEGAWTLLAQNGKLARFRYENAVDPGMPAPGFIVQYVLESALPKLMKEFRAEAELLARERGTDA